MTFGARDPRVCPTGKRQFRTKAQAKRRARREKRMPRIPGSTHLRAQYVYLCRCGWWHLTSQKQRSL